MTGWKTWVGGIGGILAGLALIADGVVNNFDFSKISQGVLAVSAGFAAIGIGHKIEKAAASSAGS